MSGSGRDWDEADFTGFQQFELPVGATSGCKQDSPKSDAFPGVGQPPARGRRRAPKATARQTGTADACAVFCSIRAAPRRAVTCFHEERGQLGWCFHTIRRFATRPDGLAPRDGLGKICFGKGRVLFLFGWVNHPSRSGSESRAVPIPTGRLNK